MIYTTEQIDKTVTTILSFTDKKPKTNVITWLVAKQFEELCGDYQLNNIKGESYDPQTGQVEPSEYTPKGKRTYWGERYFKPILTGLSHYNINPTTKKNKSPICHMQSALDRQGTDEKDGTDKYKSVNTYTHEVTTDHQAVMDDFKLQGLEANYENNAEGIVLFKEHELAMLACHKLYFGYEFTHWTQIKAQEERTKKLAADRRANNQYLAMLQQRLTAIGNASSSCKTDEEKKSNSTQFSEVSRMIADAKAQSDKMGEVVDAELVS